MRQRCGAPARAVDARADAAVDEHVVALAAERHAGRSAAVGRLEVRRGRRCRCRSARAPVSSATPTRLGRVLDEQRAVQAEADLRGRHHVRVIPEQTGVRHDEVVGERAARLAPPAARCSGTPSISIGTRRPCQWTVVGCGSWFVKCTISRSPTLHANQRAGNAAVVGPRVDPFARRRVSTGATRASRLISTMCGSGLRSGASRSLRSAVPAGRLEAGRPLWPAMRPDASVAATRPTAARARHALNMYLKYIFIQE